MNKHFIIIYLLLLSSVSAFAQTQQNSAPVKWELYRVSSKKVSLLLPKMPVVSSTKLICSQTETQNYYVYAENVVYGLNIYSKLNENVPDFCPSKSIFDKNSFNTRINELLKSNELTESKKSKLNGYEAEFIKGKRSDHWLINDYKNLQWFELVIINSDENKKESKDFINSINIDKNISGIEINGGAESTLGDIAVKNVEDNASEKSVDESGLETTAIRFVSKPQPKYTDLARKNNITGAVVLRVTFLANGGVGSISPVRGLEYGLTEQAIVAAKKLVFIPRKVKGKNQSVTISVQYTFTIY